LEAQGGPIEQDPAPASDIQDLFIPAPGNGIQDLIPKVEAKSLPSQDKEHSPDHGQKR
jgi:hypothetical protein